MSKWLSMLKNEISPDYEPTKPQKSNLVGLVGSESVDFQKNKMARWLSQINPKKNLVGLVGSESRQNEKIKPKVWIWKLKIQSLDGKSINSMTMIDPHRMSKSECKLHLARQYGENRVIEFKEVTTKQIKTNY